MTEPQDDAAAGTQSGTGQKEDKLGRIYTTVLGTVKYREAWEYLEEQLRTGGPRSALTVRSD